MSDPLVIAHRGGAGVWPENTADAFVHAHRAGCVLETDVRVTADGVAVCFHDATLDRCTGQRGRTSETTLADLRGRLADAGLPLVTVADLLGGLPGARVVLDVKEPAGVDVLAAVIRRTAAADRVVATGCFDPALARLRRGVGPDLRTGLGWWSVAALAAGAPVRVPPGATWAFLPVRLARPRTLDRAKALGLRVGVWTVDSPATAGALVALGADAVTTDRPDRLLPVLRPRARPADRSTSPTAALRAVA